MTWPNRSTTSWRRQRRRRGPDIASSTAADAAAGIRARRPRPRRRRTHWPTVLLFMSPWIIGFSVFIVYPMVSSLYFSFTHYDLIGSPIWIGLDNYKYMFTEDVLFWQAIRNTVWFIVVAVPLQIVFAIFTASLLTRPRRGVKVYRTLFFLPAIAPVVAGALAFLFLFNPSYGPVNAFLSAVGVSHPPTWFYSPTSSKWALVILALWGVGEAMIIFLAGLLDVPQQLYEAADIEGASAWQKFRRVTLPMITPVIFFSLVIGVIQAFQYFTQAYVASTTLGGQRSSLGAPQNSLLFYAIYLYQQGFNYFRMGYASALAWVLFVVTMACTITLIKTSKRWVHYQGGMFK